VKGIRLKDIVIDARHPAGLARFWATVLGYQVRAYEQDDIAFLASIGRTPESDPAVAIDPPEGVSAPSVFFNEVPELKSMKNRVHLDVWLPGADVGPLVGLGATVLRGPDEDIDWWVVADPEGNEFCAFPAA
jgi:Glyoxalase-like domain